MEEENIDNFIHHFEELMINIQKYEPIAVISHDNTDLDGAASVLGIALIFEYYYDISVGIDAILSHTSQFVTQTLRTIQLDEKIITDDANGRKTYNLVILVDTPYVPPYFQADYKKILHIDHHHKSQITDENNSEHPSYIPQEKTLSSLIDSTASSCSEIIGYIWRYLDSHTATKRKSSNFLKESKIAQLLLMGILLDSSGLRFSKNSVIPVLDFLTQKGADLPMARELSIREFPLDVKIARIKGAIRAGEPIHINNWIVLITSVNSHESAVCNALLGLGADLAFCISKRKKKTFRIIARSSERIQHASDFHLGKFMDLLAIKYEGNSGGHKGAAGMNGQNYHQGLKKEIITELTKEINNSILYQNDPE
jgi:nanoRNase/pAp phosphatase (c-di-AMP/oligoRNAs hydrolase)